MARCHDTKEEDNEEDGQAAKTALTAALAVAASARQQRPGQYPSAQMRRWSGLLFILHSSQMAAAENNFYLLQIINVSGSF